MKERKEKRINKKFMVSLNENDFGKLGLTQNISKSGICIASEKKAPSQKEIDLSIAVPGEIFSLKGEVIWCKIAEDKNDNIPESIGIKIVEAPAEYLNFIEYLKRQNIDQGKPGL